MESGVSTLRPQTVQDILHTLLPDLMKQYDARPWDYKIFGPQGMDDLSTITVYLDFGKEYCERTVIVSLELLAIKAAILSVRINTKPRKKAKEKPCPAEG